MPWPEFIQCVHVMLVEILPRSWSRAASSVRVGFALCVLLALVSSMSHVPAPAIASDVRMCENCTWLESTPTSGMSILRGEGPACGDALFAPPLQVVSPVGETRGGSHALRSIDSREHAFQVGAARLPLRPFAGRSDPPPPRYIVNCSLLT